jgi:hypothetical protein
MMRFNKTSKTLYFNAGPVAHKCLEVGGGQMCLATARDGSYNLLLSLKDQGDHAGLTFYASLGRWMFEFNIHDDRHWNWAKGRFYEPGEEAVFEGYPHE